VLSEYEQHFALKIADGYGEEEIAARLEKPEILAEQFAQAENGEKRGAGRFFVGLGVCFLSVFAVAFLVALFAWVAVMGAFALGSMGLGMSLVSAQDPLRIIPPMPYAGSLIMGLSAVALSVLGVVGTAYSYLYARQLGRAYFRWARNKLDAGRRAYPSLPLHPQLNAIFRRRLRGVALVSLAAFGVSFIVGFAVMAGIAGSPGFWHVWRWFR
jgi:uncharacterized membrane protein